MRTKRFPFFPQAAIALLLLGVSAASAFAAEAVARRAFDVPAEKADAALKRFAEQSGLEIVYRPEILAGVQTARVKGTFEPLEALQLLLKGTPLTMQREHNGMITLRRPVGAAGAPETGDRARPPRATTPFNLSPRQPTTR